MFATEVSILNQENTKSRSSFDALILVMLSNIETRCLLE